MKRAFLWLCWLSLFSVKPVWGVQLEGYVGLEGRYFANPPLSDRQYSSVNPSIVVAPRYVYDTDKTSVELEAYLRWDKGDSERSHSDIRSFNVQKRWDQYSLRVGVHQVFWGVTEFIRVVNVINQVDQLEGVDDESLLGQPMVQAEVYGRWGTLQAFVLPYFRERRYPGDRGRLRGAVVDSRAATYTSTKKKRNIDYALRWSTIAGPLDLGLSYFDGTQRNPSFRLAESSRGSEPLLVPHYDQIRQIGLDAQVTTEILLAKLEYKTVWARRGENYNAFALGIEYPIVGIGGSSLDAGLVLEYTRDSRGARAPTPFENDWALGTRFEFNNINDTSVLLGMVYSPKDQAKFYSIEGSTRLGDKWRLTMEARAFVDVAATNPVYGLREDDYLELRLDRYF